MSGPVLTPEEVANLKTESTRQTSFADSLLAAIPAKQARAAELAVTDGAFKKFFNYYNDDIIGKYDAERKALSGLFIAAPITEADVVGPAHIDGSVRTTPSLPATDIIRVAEFDGGGTTTTTVNEQQAISDQAITEGRLVSGYTPQPTINLTTVTTSALTSASTTLGVSDSTLPITFTIGDYFVVKSISDSALVKVTSVTPGVGGPPYLSTLGILVVVPPAGTLAIGDSLVTFAGFSNVERTAKTATLPALQNILNFLVTTLQTQITLRGARLNEELVALGLNLDPDATAQITATLVNVNASKTFLTNYLITTDISDTGLATLSTERATRGAQITARLVQIAANYTGQTENYYNRRYSIANDRANTSHGTLRLQLATSDSVGTLVTYSASAQAAAAAIKGLLP